VAKIELDGSMILMLENQLLPVEALMELIDNCSDAEATRILIVLTAKTMTVSDDGVGCDDLDKIGTPTKSSSRLKPNKIGRIGIGAKQAMGTFGRRWLLESVTRKGLEYRRYEMKWNPKGELPDKYAGAPLPLDKAPIDIRNGGTRITVSNRQEGVSYTLDRLCRTLEATFRPLLSNGAEIYVRDPDTGFDRQLRNIWSLAKFVKPLLTFNGTAAGRPFKVRAGVLKDADEALSGCHLLFYPRVLQTWQRIGRNALPSRCSIDVILGDEWKELLGTNKNRIRWADALDTALDELLSGWIAKQQRESVNVRVKLIMGLATTQIHNAIAYLNKQLEGEYGPKPRKPREPNPDPKPRKEPDPNRIIFKRRIRAYPDGKYGIDNDAPGCLDLEIVPDTGLGNMLYDIVYTPSKGIVTVKINTGPEQNFFQKLGASDKKGFIEKAAIEVLKVAYFAYGQAASLMHEESEPLFAALTKLGYDIGSDTKHIHIASMVTNYFYNSLAKPLPSIEVVSGRAA
jgi:histidine kinase/DNA gyrase B/HSP90-like ATPase